MQKEQRKSIILEIIGEKQVSRQDEIAEILESKGCLVTQSSVSRDLLELGIVKAGGFYARPQRMRTEMTVGVKSLEIAGDNIIVATTEAGLASACAVRIDAAVIDEIVGTIAGDDTIFIAVRGPKEQKTALKRLWELFEV